MADKSFGVKELNLLNASGTPTITSPNNLNLNANTVAISTSVTVGQNLTVSANAGIASLNVTGIATIAQPADSNPMANWTITNNSASAYRFTGPGQSGSDDNPDLYLVRGHRYIFKHNATSSHPIQIRVASGGAAYTDGITYSDTGNNRTTDGNNLIINLQHDAPARLFYQCTAHGGMVGNIYTVGGPQVISGVTTSTTFSGNFSGGTVSGTTGTFTGDVDIADKIVHTGDTDTAIRFPSADTIQFETGGSNKLSIGSSITSTTAITIHNADPELTFRDSNHSPYYYHFKAVGGSFNLSDSVNGNRMQFSANGSASIVAGTTVFTGGAQVSSNLGVTGNLILSDQIQHDGDTDTRIRFPAADTFSVETAGSERLRIDSTGRMTQNGTTSADTASALTLKNGQSGNDHTILELISDPNQLSMIYFGASDDRYQGQIRYKDNDHYMSFYTDQAERLRITNTGQVGIGDDSPDRELVVKNASSNSSIKIEASNASTSQLFFSDTDAENVARISVFHGSGSDQNSMIFDTGGASRLAITSDGKLGVGLITPANYGIHAEQSSQSVYYRADSGSVDSIYGSATSLGYAIAGTTSNHPFVFFTNNAERVRITQHGTITNTTTSSHSQGAGTFNIKGVINQYSQGSTSGLIFDCDFGRLTGYSDNAGIGNGTNLSAALAHSTTAWVSSSSNTPMTVNGGSFNYRVGFGGYLDCVQNEGRVSIGAGSGSPNMAQLLNTASMTIESWIWYDGAGREVIVSRYGSGFPNQFNMLCDPNGQFHYNNSGVGAGSGNITGQNFPDKTWHHHVWQYDSGNNVNRWYINGAFANSASAGSSLAVSDNSGFAIASRADDMERWDGKIAVVRIYNRALSATEIKNHFELDRGRFGV